MRGCGEDGGEVGGLMNNLVSVAFFFFDYVICLRGWSLGESSLIMVAIGSSLRFWRFGLLKLLTYLLCTIYYLLPLLFGTRQAFLVIFCSARLPTGYHFSFAYCRRLIVEMATDMSLTVGRSDSVTAIKEPMSR
jgi:hypothetical protein